MSDHVYRPSSATEELTSEDERYYRDLPAIPRQHQIGRTPPPAPAEPSFDIKLDGQVIGTVFPMRLTGAAQIDLEDAQSTRAVIRWLVTYAGGDATKVEAMLRALPLPEITAFVKSVAGALSQSIALGNGSGPRS